MNVVLAGGGTAGHVNPALALARALAPDAITFLGTARGAEARLVPAAGYELEVIEVRGFDRSRPAALPAVGLVAMKAVGRARAALRRVRADVVVGMGGYVSLPVCLAARSIGVPVVLHEQNIVIGLANRVSKAIAHTVAVSFEETLAQTGSKGVFVGNPVRPELAELDREPARERAVKRFELDAGRSTLLVFGGSQGARTINEAAAGLAESWANRGDLQVLHIAGGGHADALAPRVAREGNLIYRVLDYVDDMSEPYAAADLALCRGGATTVAELAVAGLPAIIVPYPHHRDRQQERQGRVLERAGAALLLADEDTTSERVAQEAGRLLADPATLAKMRSGALAVARPDAAARLAEVVRAAGRRGGDHDA